MIRSIVDRGCAPLIKHTVSCTRTYEMSRLHTHCGCCSQCLDRRFAVRAATAAEHDPEEMYKVDLLTGQRDKSTDQTMAESFLRTALAFRDMSELAFVGRFAGETMRVCSGFPEMRPDDVASKILRLHQRHGQAIFEVMTAAIARHSAGLVDGNLPASSVLMITVARGATPVVSSVAKHADPIETLIEEESKVTSRDRGRNAHNAAIQSLPATVGQETKAIKALASHLEANVDLSRAAAAEWCRKRGYKLGKRAFERVWPQAREAAGLGRIGSPGRKRKASSSIHPPNR